MKIGLNAMQYQEENSGIGQYIKALYAELIPALLNNSKAEEIIVYQTQESPPLMEGTDHKAVKIVRLPVSKASAVKRVLYEQTLLSRRLQHDQVDLYFTSDTKLPWLISPRIKTVVVLHDLCVFRWPEEYQISRVWYWQRVFARSLQKADRIIAVSEFTCQEAQDILGIAADKIRVVHNGVEPRFQPVHDSTILQRVRQLYGLPRDFILFVGQVSPRKNLGTLLTALKELQNIYPELELVVAGSKGWKDEPERAAVTSLGIEAKVHFPGYVEDADLPAIYNLARLLVYPSLYEGFGMPPLEAMACGTLCVAGQTSSIPEVTGGCVLLAEPHPDPIATAIGRVLSMTNEEKQQWQKRGLEHAAGYTWGRAARESCRVVLETL